MEPIRETRPGKGPNNRSSIDHRPTDDPLAVHRPTSLAEPRFSVRIGTLMRNPCCRPLRERSTCARR